MKPLRWHFEERAKRVKLYFLLWDSGVSTFNKLIIQGSDDSSVEMSTIQLRFYYKKYKVAPPSIESENSTDTLK